MNRLRHGRQPSGLRPVSDRAAAFVVILTVLTVLLSGCGSPEKYKKHPAAEADTTQQQAPPMKLLAGPTGWMRRMAQRLEEAKQMAGAGDTTRAIYEVDSLLRVAGETLDTIPTPASFNRFLLLFVADGYARIVEWEQARGDSTAAATHMRRFEALAARLAERRRSAAKDSL